MNKQICNIFDSCMCIRFSIYYDIIDSIYHTSYGPKLDITINSIKYASKTILPYNSKNCKIISLGNTNPFQSIINYKFKNV